MGWFLIAQAFWLLGDRCGRNAADSPLKFLKTKKTKKKKEKRGKKVKKLGAGDESNLFDLRASPTMLAPP